MIRQIYRPTRPAHAEARLALRMTCSPPANWTIGTEPSVLRRWAQMAEGLGFDLLMLSDHVVVTPDVAEQYPAPFYEPFTTLAWLAGITARTMACCPYGQRDDGPFRDRPGRRTGP
jgi:hypothetical protein